MIPTSSEWEFPSSPTVGTARFFMFLTIWWYVVMHIVVFNHISLITNKSEHLFVYVGNFSLFLCEEPIQIFCSFFLLGYLPFSYQAVGVLCVTWNEVLWNFHVLQHLLSLHDLYFHFLYAIFWWTEALIFSVNTCFFYG